MKAILLAAGRGTRISRMVEEVPKSTLPIDGIPLIRLTVELLQRSSIECIVCVGYRKEKIYEALSGLDVTYYYNPFYDVTNSIASLWFADKELDDDLLILNADVYFSQEILDLMLNDPNDVVMAIDKTRIEMGDYFFATTDSGCITKYGKDLPLEERTCEYVGLCRLKKSFCPSFLNRMYKLIGECKHSMWWENILYSFAEEREIHTADVNGQFWSEIDYFDDYERILRHVKSEKGVSNE